MSPVLISLRRGVVDTLDGDLVLFVPPVSLETGTSGVSPQASFSCSTNLGMTHGPWSVLYDIPPSNRNVVGPVLPQ